MTRVLALAAATLVALSGCGRKEPAAQAVAPAPAATQTRAPFPLPPPRMPRGLITNRPEAAEGFVLFSPVLSDTTYLVDNEGRVVHLWKTSYAPGGDLELLPNGNLLRGARDPANLAFRVGGVGGILQELDWNGRAVWEWKLSDERHVHHHDVTAMPNGNLLLLGWETKSPDEARRAGRRSDQLPEQGLYAEVVLEIEPIRPQGAKVVWEWHAWDHLVQDVDAAADYYGDPARELGRIDVNADVEAPGVDPAQLAQLKALGYVQADAKPRDLASDFLHVNTVAFHPRLNQIALSTPALGEVWILDHSTTTAEAAGRQGGRAGHGGEILYRWGNPATYRRSLPQRLFGQHDVRWIPEGWEGAGNLLVFNNGRDRPEGPWSSVEEWTPPVGADGGYALVGESFGPATLAWQYKAPEPTSLFSPIISGAQRIRNGNTLICEGAGGRFLEVTRGGELVWEYRNPFWGDVRNVDGSFPQPRIGDRPFSVFRATRIAPDDPALAGRTLTPLDPQPAWYDWKPPAS